MNISWKTVFNVKLFFLTEHHTTSQYAHYHHFRFNDKLTFLTNQPFLIVAICDWTIECCGNEIIYMEMSTFVLKINGIYSQNSIQIAATDFMGEILINVVLLFLCLLFLFQRFIVDTSNSKSSWWARALVTAIHTNWNIEMRREWEREREKVANVCKNINFIPFLGSDTRIAEISVIYYYDYSTCMHRQTAY